MHDGGQVDEDGRRPAERGTGLAAVPDDDERRYHDDGGPDGGAAEAGPGRGQHEHPESSGQQTGLTH